MMPHESREKPWEQFYSSSEKSPYTPPSWKNLRDALQSAATRFANQKAFTTVLPNGFESTQTFADVDKLSDYFAAYLRLHLRLEKGDRVAIQLPNCPSWPICAFGVLKAGCVLVNTNPMYTEHEMEHLLSDSEAKVLVTMNLFLGKLDKAIPPTKVRNIVVADLGDFFPFPKSQLISISMRIKKQVGKTRMPTESLAASIRHGRAHFRATRPWDSGFWGPKKETNNSNSTEILPSDLALLQYTGGTTGVSKAAMLTHNNIIENVKQVTEFAREKLAIGKECMLTALPLYHVFAFTVNGLTFYAIGAHNILIPNPRPITNLIPAFHKHNITWMSGVNTLFNALVQESWFSKATIEKIKVAIAGGAALQRAVAEKWNAKGGRELVEGYGLTEASPVVCFNPVASGQKSRLGSIGIPLPRTMVRIVDEQGNTLPAGETGEIQVKGPQVMQGYWKRDDETANVFRDGWLCTGDIGVMEKDGFFSIVDRKKDMILVSGFNVYPNEVEDVLVSHPGIREAAVIGIPDNTTGEQVRAYIIPSANDLNLEDIKAHCREFLTSYKVPRSFLIRTELPKSNVGKILRKELRKEAIEELEKRGKTNS
jgi:long-chain acyl-CoA synthetase